MTQNMETVRKAPLVPDLGPRVGARVFVAGRGEAVVLAVGLSRWGQRMWRCQLLSGKIVSASRSRLRSL